jgi:ATP-binding cassette subfamily B protein AbcA/BmrA
MKKKASYRPEKVTLPEYIGIFKGIKIPWLFYIMIFVCSIAMTLVSINLAYFTGDAVDAQGDLPTEQLVSYALGYLALAVLVAGNYIFGGVANERINLGLRRKLWRKIIYTKQSCYDKDGGEMLVSRVTTDCDYASKLFSAIVDFITLLVSLIMYISQMYALSAVLSNYMLLLIPISVVIGWGYTKLKFLIAQKLQAMLANSTGYLIERTKELTLIKTSNAQQAEIEAGREKFQYQYEMQVKSALMNAFYTALQTAYNIISIAIPFAVGASLVAAGKLSAGDVIVFYSISTVVGTNCTNIIDYVGSVRQANGALARVINTLRLPDEQNAEGKEMDVPDADLTFEQVTFGYTEQSVLKQVSCTIPKHKVTAIIGSNGSGKSTMFKLMQRLYEPTEGQLQFGGEDAKNYRLSAWRKTFAVVAQDSPLMEGTIRENICYGCERNVSEEELVKVAKLARIYDFVAALPEGFETQVRSGGQNFSGGQRQCIAIARAMMCGCDYLLLDEATSNLDAKGERAVMEALDELMKGRTTVIIAHSLEAIRKADHIIVLRDGRVEASGSPKQVLENSNSYLNKVMQRRAQSAV